MADLGDSRVELRASFVPIAGGESIVLRLLGGTQAPRDLSALGFNVSDIGTIEGLLAHPHGLILVSGPTGSGKTTTLSAMLRRLPSDRLKVISIEDPIEYVIPGVCQIQTNDSIGLDFKGLLRRILRQDPSVIMVGEIRDADTAELSVRAALTGHLVLSSLHTNDAASCVSRLRDLGVEPYLIAATLRAALAQRLLRRVCPHCASGVPATPEERALAAEHGIALGSVQRAVGCPECRGTGYSGRIAVLETLELDAKTAELVSAQASVETLRTHAAFNGMRGLAASALSLVTQGVTTMDEAVREVEL
jgi:type II secretory ATPase GspE/PulE/Tfp pilus assembly ATPase PilB-like protein